MAASQQVCHTAAESFAAGQALVRERGDKLSPAQRRRIALLLRPTYLRRTDAA